MSNYEVKNILDKLFADADVVIEELSAKTGELSYIRYEGDYVDDIFGKPTRNIIYRKEQ